MSLPSRPLSGIRVLALVGDDYEDLELWYPKLRLEEAGAHVTVAGAMLRDRKKVSGLWLLRTLMWP